MSEKTGILLINLGTPEATDFKSMRRYLKEFLSDKRVIEASGPVWWLVLNGIILTRRPKKSGHAYDKIWNRERDESPLKTITRAQAEKVAAQLTDKPSLVVDWSMRYGKPSIAEGIARLSERGCHRILFFPLYPQYSAATTATAMDKVFEALKEMRWQPAVRSVPPYYDTATHITALARSIETFQLSLSWTPDVILASFHGLPVSFIESGDPYQQHCETTTALLRQTMGLSDQQLMLSYQSRTGRAEWIGPDTEETLADLARKGSRNVLVVTPGFASDCVETLEEIQIRAAQVFRENGGQEFATVPCLNDSPGSIEMLVEIIDQQLAGWA
ncbi:MAG: ferrochelatase [Rhodobacteraceae bacterium]|nr:ferrochelatase [Paracoccaceae bacterium]